MKIKVYTFLELNIFKQFLSKRLREDYVNEFFKISERILNFARIKKNLKDRKIAARNLFKKNEKNINEYYRKIVVFIIKEFIIDSVHVKRKI